MSSPGGSAPSARGYYLTAALIVAVAFGVRCWGVGFGLPYDLTADEPHQIVQALKIGAGEGGPLVRMWHTIGKGGLDYLLFFEYGVLFAVLWLGGQLSGPRDFALLYLQDPTAFYLVGRLTVVALGAATCAFACAVGRRLYGPTVGLVAAWVGATAFFHAADSHIINVHIPMACALWAGILVYLHHEREPRSRVLFGAGLLLGAAVALAYTALVGVAMVGVRLLWLGPTSLRGRLASAAVLGCGLLVSIALMSPDLITGAGTLIANFSDLMGQRTSVPGGTTDVRTAIDNITIVRAQDWTGYLRVLLMPHNLGSTVMAAVGIAVGVWRRDRWTLLLGSSIVVLVLGLSASSRGLSESYLFPMIPAVWIMAGRGVVTLAMGRQWLLVTLAALITAFPLYSIVLDDYMLTQPDTRVVAKGWVEANVPSGSTILMDGMRFRFVQGVPLNPDAASVDRRLTDVEASELALSSETLALYREAATRITGPRYNLHSTLYGMNVESLDHYVEQCVDYVITSSFNEKRFEGEAARRQYPQSAAFYEGIRRDPRYERLYSVEPVMWERVGPTITVYRVRCAAKAG